MAEAAAPPDCRRIYHAGCGLTSSPRQPPTRPAAPRYTIEPPSPTATPTTPPEQRSGVAGVELRGFSLGGVETSVWVPPWRLAFDVGRGPRELLRCEHLALTHGHMDHAAGLPYLLALRQLYGAGPPTVYAPPQVVGEVKAMVHAWDALQGFESRFELIAAEPGVGYPLRGDLELVPFRTIHRGPSVGYTVVRKTLKLRAEHHGRPGQELAALRRDGVVLTVERREPLLSVTGDTLPEVLDRQPEILQSRVVVHECTFLDGQKPYAACRAGGHTHLRDLLERADALTCEHLVLSHFSQIHRPRDIPGLLRPLADRIPGRLYAFPTTPGAPLRGPVGEAQ